jgi:cobalamin biosynthesis Co2+ chelatase CbiK
LPLISRITRVNSLYDSGHTVIFLTARGAISGVDYQSLTERQLLEWGVKFHKLYMGKPFADYYIDDKGLSDIEFFDNMQLDENHLG